MGRKSHRRVAWKYTRMALNCGNTPCCQQNSAMHLNYHMKNRLPLFAGAALVVAGSLNAGTLELQPKESSPPSIIESEPWQFTIAAPGWLASLNGTIGVRGVDANIDIPVNEVLQHLD